jgi:hypothetical protein
MRPWTGEETLLRDQLRWDRGIFACDDTIVISSALINLGTNYYGRNVFTWVNPPPSNAIGNLNEPGVTTNSWLNTATFITAFATIMSDSQDRIWNNDFFVKVDPDAVLFPDRLRQHVSKFLGESVYFLNCVPNKLYGALEVYSLQAMLVYKDGHRRCQQEMNWKGWGEDSYFSRCFSMLGVRGISDYTLVGDERCMRAPCSDPWRAAFHPFKDTGSWSYCWQMSAGS